MIYHFNILFNSLLDQAQNLIMNKLFNNGYIKIHLKSRNGVYRVFSVGVSTITLQTHDYSFRVPHSDFKCFAGNFKLTKKQANYFMALLGKNNLQKQLDSVKRKIEDEYIKQKNNSADIKYKIDSYYDKLEESYYLLQKKLLVQKESHEKEIKEIIKKKMENVINSEEMRKYKLDKAAEIYQHCIDLSNYQNHNGIKFIIQQYDDKSNNNWQYRMFFDPFKFVDNWHSSLTQITDEIEYKTNGKIWRTNSGGWLKVIDNAVVLYARSGDYGVFDNDIAIECAKKLFPTKEIYSYADLDWDHSMLTKNPGTLFSFYGGYEFAGDKFRNSLFELDEDLIMDSYSGDGYKSYYVYKKHLSKDANKFISDMLSPTYRLCKIDGKSCYIHSQRNSYILHFYYPDINSNKESK
jgi:hypothetical protein